MRYDWYGCWTPITPPDPPPSRIALVLPRRRLRERRADPPHIFEQLVAAIKDDEATA